MKDIINMPIINEQIAGTKIINIFDRPDSFMVLNSLFFKNLTKKKIPENKKMNIDVSIIVFGVLHKVK